MENNNSTTPVVENEKRGALNDSLKRGNKAIREQRGDAIYEELELVYKREVENKKVELKRIDRKMANAFDFSVNNINSLIMKTEDFDAGQVMIDDLQLGWDRSKILDKANIAIKRYNFLFGQTFESLS